MKARITTLYKEQLRKLIVDEAQGNCFAYVSVHVTRWEASDYTLGNLYLIMVESGYIQGRGEEITRYGRKYEVTPLMFHSSQFPGDLDEWEWSGPVKVALKELESQMRLLLRNVERLGLSWEGPCGAEELPL